MKKWSIKGKIAIGLILILFCSFCLFYALPKRIYSKKYSTFVTRYSALYSIDENLIYAVIKAESNFDKNAKSNKGAIGLMQIKNSTFLYLKELLNDDTSSSLFDVETNIKYGTFYLKYLKEKFIFQKEILVAYNAGEGNLVRWLNDENYSKNKMQIDYIPFKETREYVKKVDRYKKLYDKIYK